MTAGWEESQLLTLLIDIARPALLAPLLARSAIPQENLAESPPRASLLRLIREHPGISSGRLRRKASLGWGSFSYHVRRLVDARLVSATRRGKRSYLSTAPSTAEVAGDAADVISSRAARQIAYTVLATPGLDVRSVADATGISRRMTYYHVGRLLNVDLIRSASRTRHVDLRPAPHLADVLRDYPIIE